MKFSTRVDIEAPISFVFAALTDVAALERAAMRSGVEVHRLDEGALDPRRGMSWDLRFRMRGKMRCVVVTIATIEPPETLAFTGESSNFEISAEFSLLALARHRTRLSVAMEVRPRTLAGRVMLQSARFGKATLDRRYADRMRLFGLELEDRYSRGGH